MTKSSNPACVEVTRGEFVESTHAVDIVVADADGGVLQSWGDAGLEIFPRSSVKLIQALPLVESGAADAFGFEDRHLALACSSHNGETIHVDTAKDMLSRCGVEEGCLECGAQNPFLASDFAKLVNSGEKPSAIHNPCSGKHAGFLAFATHAGIPEKGYIGFKHEVQNEVASVLEIVTGNPHNSKNYGIDGCSIPTYRTPLNSIAKAYARIGVGHDPSRTRSNAMIRLRDACSREPYMVAGNSRVCSGLMALMPGEAIVKFGAEGVYTASLPKLGLGIALKARDGSARAAEVAVSAVIGMVLKQSQKHNAKLKRFSSPVLKNRNGLEIGAIRVIF